MMHAKRKNTLPNIAQKFPILEIINPIDERIKRNQPKRFIFLLSTSKSLYLLKL